MHFRLSGRHKHSRVYSVAFREERTWRVRRHHRDQPAAVNLRTRLSAGDTMRRRVHRRRHVAGRGDRATRALCRRQRDQGTVDQHPLHRAEPIQDRRRRIRRGWHRTRGGHGDSRLRCHGVRSVPPARRRAALWHPGFPSAERGDRRGNRETEIVRCEVRMQHYGRPSVHDRADE